MNPSTKTLRGLFILLGVLLATMSVACHVAKRRKKAEQYLEALKSASDSVGRLTHTMKGATSFVSAAPDEPQPLVSHTPAFFTQHLLPSLADTRKSLAKARSAGARCRKGSSGALKKETRRIQAILKADEALLRRLSKAVAVFAAGPTSPQARAELQAVEVAWKARGAKAKKDFDSDPQRKGILTLGHPLQYWYELAAVRILNAVIKTENDEDNVFFYAMISARIAVPVLVLILAIIFGLRLARRFRRAGEEKIDGTTCTACGGSDIETLQEGQYRCRTCDYSGRADP